MNGDDRCVLLYADGYGDSCPLLVELYEGQLCVVVWGDINREDPTHIISLKGARTSARKAE